MSTDCNDAQPGDDCPEPALKTLTREEVLACLEQGRKDAADLDRTLAQVFCSPWSLDLVLD